MAERSGQTRWGSDTGGARWRSASPSLRPLISFIPACAQELIHLSLAHTLLSEAPQVPPSPRPMVPCREPLKKQVPAWVGLGPSLNVWHLEKLMEE